MKVVAVALGALALVAAGVSLKMAVDANLVAEDARSAAARVGKDLDAARREVEVLRAEAKEGEQARRAAEERVAALEGRVAALAASPGRSPAGAAAGTDGGTQDPGAPTAAGTARASGVDPVLAGEFRELRKRFFKGEATADEQKRFWELAKSPGLLDGILSDMESTVAASPEDIALRMELSQAYIAKIFTVPPGPEMGTWAAKAETQWKEVLARDDRHWEARMALATSYARYPEFLNKTADSIREFETLRRQQEGTPAEEKQARVYLELGGLYKRAGNAEKQRAVLEEGLRRHPADEELKKALEVLDAR